MTPRPDERLASVDTMKREHYAHCSGCYTCKPGQFAAPVSEPIAQADARPEMTSGRGEPKPVNPGLRAAVEYLVQYEGTWEFMLTLKAEAEAGKLRFTDRVIEVILNSKARDEARPKATPKPEFVPVEGWFRVDGVVVKVQKAVHGSGHLYAKRLVLDDGDARWEYTPGLVNECTPDRALTLEEAQAMGRLYGVCVVCGATLTDEESIERGIGPICYGKLA